MWLPAKPVMPVIRTLKWGFLQTLFTLLYGIERPGAKPLADLSLRIADFGPPSPMVQAITSRATMFTTPCRKESRKIPYEQSIRNPQSAIRNYRRFRPRRRLQRRLLALAAPRLPS